MNHMKQKTWIHSGLIAVVSCCVLLLSTFHTTYSASAYQADTGWMEVCGENCGFEYNSMYGWVSVGGSFPISTDKVRTGRYSVKGTNATQAYFYRDIAISQHWFNIDMGYGTYNVVAYFDNGDQEYGRMVIRYFNGAYEQIATAHDSGWLRYS